MMFTGINPPGLMAVAAIGFAGRAAIVHSGDARSASAASFTMRDDWRALAEGGRRIGAADAGVAEPGVFSACMQDSVSASRVRRDVVQAQQLRLTRTPTVLLNERFYEHRTPSPSEVSSVVDSMLLSTERKPNN